MTQVAALPGRQSFGQTARKDAWWLQSLIVVAVFGSFILYSTWAAFQGEHYHFGNYLSPFYSPELFGESHHAWFGPKPPFWPGWLPFSPALLILWMPGGFRFTCYYYRGAYYKAFWADPPSCAVGEPRKSYIGERSFPLIMQNVHRYFMYLAVAFLFVLAYDAWRGLWFVDPATGQERLGFGLGSLVLIVNVVLLSAYTLGCHSLRHLVGGGLTQISKRPVRHKAYQGVSVLNRRHMLFAWFSLFWVAFSDIYVRMLSMGVWHDWRLF